LNLRTCPGDNAWRLKTIFKVFQATTGKEKQKRSKTLAIAVDKPFIFFDLDQTLVDESDFINHFDQRFLELLNGFGANIDQRSYCAVRDSVIRDRRIGHGGLSALITEICSLVLSPGHGKIISERLEPQILEARRDLFRFHDVASVVLHDLADKGYEMGLIANQSEDISDLLEKFGLGEYFKVSVISSLVQLKKPDPRIFYLALGKAGYEAADCIMVGDRLDTDICPANRLGMKTIRTTSSLFRLQNPMSECENPTFTVSTLSEIPGVLERID
jgi:putative hydrolase of the HAD superfamily